DTDVGVPMHNTLEMYSVLQRMRVPARLLVWPDENHWIQKGENSKVFYREVREGLAQWLRDRDPAAAPSRPASAARGGRISPPTPSSWSPRPTSGRARDASASTLAGPDPPGSISTTVSISGRHRGSRRKGNGGRKG